MNPAGAFPALVCATGVQLGKEQCELALELMNTRAEIKEQVHCQLLKPEGQRVALSMEQKALSPALSRTLEVLQPGLSQHRNSTPSARPFSQIPHPCFSITFQDFATTSPAVSCHFWIFIPPLQKMPGLYGRRDSSAVPCTSLRVLAWERPAQIP